MPTQTRSRPSSIALVLFFVSLLIFLGCGGGGGGGTTGITTSTTATTSTNATTSTTSGQISVAVSPASVTLLTEDVQQFTATVTGTSNQNVIWSIQQGSAGGTIDNTGFYQAPQAGGNYTIVAASSADPSKVGTAQVTVMPGIVVVINPQDVTVQKGAQFQFTASVFNASNPAVIWDVLEQVGTNVGTVSNSGLYTAPQNSGAFVVIVESVEDPLSGNDFAIVTVP